MRTLTIGDPAVLAVRHTPPPVASTAAVWWAGDLAVANGDPVGSWVDRVNGVTVSNTSTARPTFNATGIGGKGAVVFDGSNDYLEVAAALSSAATGSVVAVIKDPVAGGAVWAQSLASSAVIYSYQIANGGSPAALRYDHSTWSWSRGASAIVKRGQTVITSGTFITEITCTTGRTHTMYLNGAAETITTTMDSGAVGGWFSGLTGANRWTIGALTFNDTRVGFLNGAIAYLGVFNAPLSAEDRAALYAWLGAYYGITVA